MNDVKEIRSALRVYDSWQKSIKKRYPEADQIGPAPTYARLARAARAYVELVESGEVMRGALEAIINFDPAWQSWEHPDPDCKDCKHAKDRRWPPSGLCHAHYSPFADHQRRNQRAVDSQWLDMKRIARTALAAVVPVEADDED